MIWRKSAWFFGSGMWFFDESLTRFSATNDPMPFAKSFHDKFWPNEFLDTKRGTRTRAHRRYSKIEIDIMITSN